MVNCATSFMLTFHVLCHLSHHGADPHAGGAWIITVSSEPWISPFLINLMLLVVGCFVDNISSMIILMPIFSCHKTDRHDLSILEWSRPRSRHRFYYPSLWGQSFCSISCFWGKVRQHIQKDLPLCGSHGRLSGSFYIFPGHQHGISQSFNAIILSGRLLNRPF